MKNLLLILITCFMCLGTSPSGTDEDFNTYSATLTEITVTANMLEGYAPIRAKSKEEFIELNKVLLKYVAKHSWMSEAQVYGKLRQEQGLGSELFYKHNNPFNIKGDRASGTVTYRTKENRKDGTEYTITSKFARYDSIEDSLKDFIEFIHNDRYNHIPASNAIVFKHFYTKGYHTDPRWRLRAKYADYYENLNV